MVGRGDVDRPAVTLDSFGIPLGHEVLVPPSVAKGYIGERISLVDIWRERPRRKWTHISDAHTRPMHASLTVPPRQSSIMKSSGRRVRDNV